MDTTNYEWLHREGETPIKGWVRGVPLEDKAHAQLRNIASLLFGGPWVAVMPDVHLGIGATPRTVRLMGSRLRDGGIRRSRWPSLPFS